MIRGLHHIAISTPNLNRLLGFYRDLLGFQEVSRTSWPKGSTQVDQVLGLRDSAATTVMLKTENLCMELFEFDAPAAPPADAERPVHHYGLTHVCLDVTDIDGVYKRMLDAGVRFHCPPQDFGSIKATYGRDPDGNVFEIQEVL